MHAGGINQPHIVDAGGARGHARQARQAAVHMFGYMFGCRFVIFQHVLDQIDAPARAVEFIAQQQVGWACGSAKPAMHTFAQYIVGFA